MAVRVLEAEKLVSANIVPYRLNPVEAEAKVVCTFAEPVADAEIRGRLNGPKCVYTSTVEIAYSVQTLRRNQDDPQNTVMGKIIIPEPSLWDPVSPFLYQGQLEIWSGANRLAKLHVQYGLRHFQLTPNGLRWNGKKLPIKAIDRGHLSEAEARSFHDEGYNTLICPDRNLEEMCDLAERLGFLVFVESFNPDDLMETIESLGDVASFVGWIVSEKWLEQRELLQRTAQAIAKQRQLLGMWIDRPATNEEWSTSSFLVCEEILLPECKNIPLPKLLWVDAGKRDETPQAEDVFGVLVKNR